MRRPTVVPVAPDESDAANVQLPDVESEALSYLGPPIVEVEFLSRTWTVPAVTARDWLEILWAARFDPDEIFPGLLEDPDLEDQITDALLDGSQRADELFEIAMEILEEHAGYKWWFAIKLATLIKVSWHRIGGRLVLAGVNPAALSLGAWLTACLSLLAEYTQPKAFANLLHEFNTPPDGYGPSPEELMEMSESDFLAAMDSPF